MKSSAVCLSQRETERKMRQKALTPTLTGFLLLHSLFVFHSESHPSLAREELRETVLGDMS